MRCKVAGLWVVLALSSVSGWCQWVWFQEESSSRLVLTSVEKGDPEEKDLTVGDFDQDGWQDVIVVRKVPFSVMGAREDVLLMNENGVLTDRTAALAPGFISNPTDSRDVVAADLDNDGWVDLVMANTFTQQPVYYRNRGEDLGGNWLGFVDESNSRIPNIFPVNQALGPQFCAVWAGDLNGDNRPDLYFSNYELSAGTTDALLINNGSGFFTDETETRLGDLANVAFGTSAEFHDVDGDGDLDVLKMSTLYNQAPFEPWGIFILYNNGSGNFTQFPTQRFPSADPYMFTGGLLDQNGLLDFYVVNDGADQLISITATQANGPVSLSSQTINSPRTGGFGGNVKLADVDGDGDLDIGLAPIDVDIANCGFASAKFALLRNDGNLNLSEPWSGSNDKNIHIDTHDFAFLDVNGDKRMDIVMGLCSGWAVFIQQVGPECPGDCFPDLGDGSYGDGTVDMSDLMAAVNVWGGNHESCDIMPIAGDGTVGDGQIDIADLIAIRNNFGACP